jgi:hypothetical protein
VDAAEPAIFLGKADECRAGAESEFANRRVNRCATGCCAAIQAAVADRQGASVLPAGPQWCHSFVQGHGGGDRINRRRVGPASVRRVLSDLLARRLTADD